MITTVELAVATGSNVAMASKFVDAFNEFLPIYYIDLTPERLKMFLANVGHESGRLRYTTELWGPTPAQDRYEGRADLGNVKPGDGAKYKGRGLLQTTGRANFVNLTNRLRLRFPDMDVPDFEDRPEKLAEPRWAVLSACDYADMAGLNAIADAGDFDGYCDKINRGHKTLREGDSNGYSERLALYQSDSDLA